MNERTGHRAGESHQDADSRRSGTYSGGVQSSPAIEALADAVEAGGLIDRRSGGVVLVSADDVDEDELVLAAADAGADDVERDGSTFVVSSAPEELTTVRAALEAAGLELESVGLSMIPKITVAIADESTAKQVVRLVEGLEDNDDVQDVYANFDIPEAVLEAVVS